MPLAWIRKGAEIPHQGVAEYPRPDPEKEGSMAVDEEPRIPLEERKLAYAKLAQGELPRTPTSVSSERHLLPLSGSNPSLPD
jgi:hypothetical protein